MISKRIILYLLGFSGAVFGYNLQSAENIELTPRIRGGANAYFGQFPHSVRILKNTTEPKPGEPYPVDPWFAPHCSGSIISERHILTSFRCIEKVAPEELRVVVGELQTNRSDDEQVVHNVSSLAYDMPIDDLDQITDIGVLILETPIKFRKDGDLTPAIQPAHLPDEHRLVEPGDHGLVSGWGIMNVQLQQPTTLQVLHVIVAKCPENQTDFTFCLHLPGGYLENLCKGDEGAAMVRQIENYEYELLGVYSHIQRERLDIEIPCGRGVPMLSMISKNVPWIKQLMSES